MSQLYFYVYDSLTRTGCDVKEGTLHCKPCSCSASLHSQKSLKGCKTHKIELTKEKPQTKSLHSSLFTYLQKNQQPSALQTTTVFPFQCKQTCFNWEILKSMAINKSDNSSQERHILVNNKAKQILRGIYTPWFSSAIPPVSSTPPDILPQSINNLIKTSCLPWKCICV